MTTRRAAKPQTSAGKAKKAPVHGPGGGRDRRTAKEYARALHEETLRSLKRDPSRWKWQRSNELPSRRSTEPESPP